MLFARIRWSDGGAPHFFLLSALRLTLIRKEFTEEATLGELYVDDDFACFTLEDAVRADPKPETPQNEAKVPGETAIPEGEYQVLITVSPRFKRLLPLLIDVPGYDGVRLHPGNTTEDTIGCILVGDQIDHSTPIPTIRKSRIAFERLFREMQQAPYISITVRSANGHQSQD